MFRKGTLLRSVLATVLTVAVNVVFANWVNSLFSDPVITFVGTMAYCSLLYPAFKILLAMLFSANKNSTNKFWLAGIVCAIISITFLFKVLYNAQNGIDTAMPAIIFTIAFAGVFACWLIKLPQELKDNPPK